MTSMYRREYKVSISNYPYCNKKVDVNKLEEELEQDSNEQKEAVVYIHIPFCAEICDFCIYCHEQVVNNDKIEKYTNALIREIQEYSRKSYVRSLSIKAIYFGGGTPSMLSVNQFDRILSVCKECLNLVSDVEISVEVNVLNATEKKIEQFKNSRVKRISVGIQTFSEKTRETLGLPLKQKDLLNFINMMGQYEFPVMAIDVMYGEPCQEKEEIIQDIEIASDLNISHISLYQLCVIRGTKLFSRMQQFDWVQPDESMLYAMFNVADDTLQKLGFYNTVIPEYSKYGKESVFWKDNFNPQLDRLSFGASAYGYLNGRTYQNVCNVDTYINYLQKFKVPLDSISEKVTVLQKLERDIILQSRTQVIDTKYLEDEYSELYEQMYKETLQEIIDQQLAYREKNLIKFTKPGMYMQEDIAVKFMKSILEGKSRLYKKMVIGNQKI